MNMDPSGDLRTFNVRDGSVNSLMCVISLAEHHQTVD